MLWVHHMLPDYRFPRSITPYFTHVNISKEKNIPDIHYTTFAVLSSDEWRKSSLFEYLDKLTVSQQIYTTIHLKIQLNDLANVFHLPPLEIVHIYRHVPTQKITHNQTIKDPLARSNICMSADVLSA